MLISLDDMFLYSMNYVPTEKVWSVCRCTHSAKWALIGAHAAATIAAQWSDDFEPPVERVTAFSSVSLYNLTYEADLLPLNASAVTLSLNLNSVLALRPYKVTAVRGAERRGAERVWIELCVCAARIELELIAHYTMQTASCWACVFFVAPELMWRSRSFI